MPSFSPTGFEFNVSGMQEAFLAAVEGRLDDVISHLGYVRFSSGTHLPRHVPIAAPPGWENPQGWTPGSLLAMTLLGPKFGNLNPDLQERLLAIWKHWSHFEESHGASRKPARHAATDQGLNCLAWVHLDLNYSLDSDARDQLYDLASPHPYLSRTVLKGQERAVGVEDQSSQVHLLLDPTHADIFDTVCAFSTGKLPLVWPTDQVSHVRQVVRHMAIRLATPFAADAPGSGWGDVAEGEVRRIRWLELARTKMLTIASSRSAQDVKIEKVRDWIHWLHSPTDSQTVRRATLVRLVAPLTELSLPGAIQDDQVAAGHWEAVLPWLSTVSPEALAFDRDRSLQDVAPARSTRPRLRS